MKTLKIPRVRIGQLYTLSRTTIEICNDFEALAKPLGKIGTLTTTLAAGIQKGQASAEEKEVMDDTRDMLLKGFIKAVKAEKHFPHIDEAAVAINNLDKVIDKYGYPVTRMGYTEESAALDNLVAEVEQLDLSVLSDSGLSRWLPLIDNANNKFQTADMEFIEEKIENSEIEAAYKIAPELKDALNALYTYMYSNILVNEDAEMEKAYLKLEELIDTI